MTANFEKLTWYGHAALGLETGGYKIIVDPFLNGNPTASISPEAVEADFILISHGHGDHVGDSIAIASRTDAMIISNDEIANWFAKQGVKKKRMVSTWAVDTNTLSVISS